MKSKFHIDTLMSNFRDVLIAIVPHLEAINEPWRAENEQYDAYDEIAESLFKNLVLRTISYSLDDYEIMEKYKYGFINEDRSVESFIGVLDRNKELIGRFLAYQTKSEPFDTVTAMPVDSAREILSFLAVDVGFLFMHRDERGRCSQLFEFSVDI